MGFWRSHADKCDTFVTDFQKLKDVRSKTIIFSSGFQMVYKELMDVLSKTITFSWDIQQFEILDEKK